MTAASSSTTLERAELHDDLRSEVAGLCRRFPASTGANSTTSEHIPRSSSRR